MNNLVKMTRSEYTTAKANRTLVCPNVALISDEYQKVEYLAQNPPSDIGICAWEDGHRTFYSLAQWEELATKPTALGVYVFTEDTQFIIYDKSSERYKWADTATRINGVMTAENSNSAFLDFSGKSNTQAILDAVTNGDIAEAPAAAWAHAQMLADGTVCYLPSAGQFNLLVLNKTVINDCLSEIGKPSLGFAAYQWTSTQKLDGSVWYWDLNKFTVGHATYTTVYAFAIADI